MAESTQNAAVTSIWVKDSDLKHDAENRDKKRGWGLAFLAFSALGVVYGDIGTSPLYVYSSTFPEGAPSDELLILGTFSMIFWTITVIVLFKYVLLMLRADDGGEGGVIALYSIIKRAAGVPSPTSVHPGQDEDLQAPPAQRCGRLAAAFKSSLQRSWGQQVGLLVVVLLAVNMIISDGVLTPAISVVSAVEGIQYNADLSNGAVVGISCAILVVLFFVQPFGTQKMAFLFSPIVLLWFLANASIGTYNLVRFHPSAVKALSPHYIYYYWSGDASLAWRRLGSIMLSVTGAEALYADMGHFNAKSIQLGFIAVVYPALTLTYLGQTAFILEDRAAAAHAYWASLPGAVYTPMVVLATLAAIIASQALITGSFSIAQQGIAIRCFPRLTVRYTSRHHAGQIYIPEINFSLMVGCLIIVAAFGNSTRIGNAYGLSIISVMVIDTFLLALVMLMAWNWHPAVVAVFCLIYTFISGSYLSSNLEKIPHGAWFSIVLSGILSIVAFVYWWGQATKAKFLRSNAVALSSLFEEAKGSGGAAAAAEQLPPTSALPNQPDDAVSVMSDHSTVALHPGVTQLRLVGTKLPVARLPGLGMYYSELVEGVSPSLVRLLSLAPAIHEVVVFVTIRPVLLPIVPSQQRLLVRKLSVEGFYHVVARYGYMEAVDQGTEFVQTVVEELLEYLQPGGGIDDVPSVFFGGDIESGGGSVAGDVSVRSSTRFEVEIDPGMSLGSAAGSKMMAQLLSRMSTTTGAAADAPTVEGSKNGFGRMSAAQLARPSVRASVSVERRMSLDGAPSSNMASPRDTDRPWVRAPSVLNRVRSGVIRDYGGSSNDALRSGVSFAIDSTSTVPLPPAPSRPRIHRLSVPGARLSPPETATGRRSSFWSPPPSASATLAGPAAATLAARLLDTQLLQAQQPQGPDGQQRGDLVAAQALMLAAYSHGVVHLLSRSELKSKARPGAGRISAPVRKFMLESVYRFLVTNSRHASADYNLPPETLLVMHVVFEV